MPHRVTDHDERMMAAGWLPVPLVAERTGRDKSTVYRLITAGRLRSTLSRGVKYVSRESCVEYYGEVLARECGLA